MYTLTAYNEVGFFLFTITFETWTALRDFPRTKGWSYVFDVVA